MKLMINASEPNYGVVEDFMIMDSEPVIGKWSVRAQAHNMVSMFIFLHYNSAEHEIYPAHKCYNANNS